ncbi:uclacyanin 1 [Prunus yedoensis var. nudiflora]|uniref:Uclacyanin 1 n=1 Tax=Prunus yedoensis var. nudiflora TaxID=2094558 RepID=A0A314XJ76_PRUYE|nr:uclacyanin 1 [Prunus yedoensis var. nudiflora]
MAASRTTLVSLVVVSMLMELAMAASYNVGGPNGGWDSSTDLQTWASSQTFLVGDNLRIKKLVSLLCAQIFSTHQPMMWLKFRRQTMILAKQVTQFILTVVAALPFLCLLQARGTSSVEQVDIVAKE